MIAKNIIRGSKWPTRLGAMREQRGFCQRLVGAGEMKTAIFNPPSFRNVFVLTTRQISRSVAAAENFWRKFFGPTVALGCGG